MDQQYIEKIIKKAIEHDLTEFNTQLEVIIQSFLPRFQEHVDFCMDNKIKIPDLDIFANYVDYHIEHLESDPIPYSPKFKWWQKGEYILLKTGKLLTVPSIFEKIKEVEPNITQQASL